MRIIIAITQVTLDGVMQSPGGPEEDPRNGFTHGGWAMPFLDDALNQAIGETIAGEFDMLLGPRTSEIFAAYWPNQGDNRIAKAFNKATRYVVTRSLDHLDWETSLHIVGDVADEVRRLKASDGPGIAYLGQQRIAADADRRRTRRRISHLGLSVGARRRKAAVREQRSSARPHSGRDAKHAQGRPHQHLPLRRSGQNWVVLIGRSGIVQTRLLLRTKACGPGFSVRSLPAQGNILKTFPCEIANPQPNPQNAMSCTTCAVFGSPRVLVSCCKTSPRCYHGRSRGFDSRRPRHSFPQ
jgi:hypothetical protein